MLRTRISVAVAFVAAMAASTSPAAGAPAPGTALNPPPPDSYTCSAIGAGTVCHSDTTVDLGPDPSGIFCGSGPGAFEVLDQATRRVVATRWYDVDGNLVKRVRENRFSDAQLSNPDGPTVGYRQRDLDTEYFAVAGDLGTATMYSDNSLIATAPGWGTVLVEAGLTVSDADGNVVYQNGRRDLGSYFTGHTEAVARLCAALGT